MIPTPETPELDSPNGDGQSDQSAQPADPDTQKTAKPKRKPPSAKRNQTTKSTKSSAKTKPGIKSAPTESKSTSSTSQTTEKKRRARAPANKTEAPSADSLGISIAQTEPGRSSAPPNRLLDSPTFQAFWLSRFLSQTAQGALMYGLLVLLVDSTDSSFYNSLFVICAVVPAIVFGLPAGVSVDALPKRGLLFGLNILRVVFVLALALRDPSLSGIFATALAFWTIHQFYSPAESSMLAHLVPQDRLTEAQSLSNLALITAQGIGLIVLAPLLLKTSDPRYLFAICAALFVTAALLTAQLPAMRGLPNKAPGRPRSGIRETLLNGARILTTDTVLFRVTAVDVIVGIGLSGLVVIAPLYLSRVLDTSSENTVFVFAPAAVGVLIGLRLAPLLGKHVELRVLATCSMIIFAICIASYGFMTDILAIANDTLNIPIDSIAATLKITPLALLVMVFSVPAGLSSSIVGVAARSVTLIRTPAQSRGQVIATQSLAQNLGTLVPTLMAGIAAEVIGVDRVAVLIALVMLAGAAVVFVTRRQPRAIVFPAT